jgi:hypothetical protein
MTKDQQKDMMKPENIANIIRQMTS